jgi:hypothetical protein
MPGLSGFFAYTYRLRPDEASGFLTNIPAAKMLSPGLPKRDLRPGDAQNRFGDRN